MERYKIIFDGSLTKDFQQHDVGSLLASLKFPPKVIEHIVAGRKVTIKSNLALNDAKAYQRKMRKRGLDSSLGLQLNKEIFYAGLTSKAVDTQLKKTDVNVIDDQFVAPALISVADTYEVNTASGELSYQIKSRHAFWSPHWLFIACTVIALILELQLVRVLSSVYSLSLMATVFGLVFLPLAILILPKLFQPLATIRLRDQSLKSNDKAAFINLVEYECYKPRKCRFGFYDREGNKLADFEKTHSRATLYTVDGDILFTWQRNMPMPKELESGVNDFREQIIEDSIFEQIFEYFSYLKKAFKFLSPDKEGAKVEWLDKDANPVLDKQKKVAAALFNEPDPAFRLKTNSENKLLLVAFCLCVSRPIII